MPRSLSTIWDSLLIDGRLRFQRVPFPDGLPNSEAEGSGTVAISTAINALQQSPTGDDEMARPPGVNWDQVARFLVELLDLERGFERGVTPTKGHQKWRCANARPDPLFR